MFCKKCGKEVNDNSGFCPYCGASTGVQPQSQSQYSAPTPSKTTNTIAIVGFVMSFFISIVGLICSIIGLKNSAELGGSGKGLSIAGICISVAWMIIAGFIVL